MELSLKWLPAAFCGSRIRHLPSTRSRVCLGYIQCNKFSCIIILFYRIIANMKCKQIGKIYNFHTIVGLEVVLSTHKNVLPNTMKSHISR